MSRTRRTAFDAETPPVYLVTLNRERVVGAKIFRSQHDAYVQMEEAAFRVATGAARQRRRTAKVLLWGEVARVVIGKQEWLYHVMYASHVARIDRNRYDDGCIVKEVEPNGTVRAVPPTLE
jgi:hypothetical protein